MTENSAVSKSNSTRFWWAVVACTLPWCVVLFRLWSEFPRETSILVLAMLSSGGIAWLIGQMRRGASLRLLVVVVPVVIAIVCLPVRSVVRSRWLRASLSSAGISDFVLDSHPAWAPLAVGFEGSFETRLTSATIDLETADVPRICQLSQAHLSELLIVRTSNSPALSPQLVDWLRACPKRLQLEFSLTQPNLEELRQIAAIESADVVLNLQQVPTSVFTADEQLVLPAVSRLSLVDQRQASFSRWRLHVPRLKELELQRCRLSHTTSLLHNLGPGQRVSLIDCHLDAQSWNEVLSAPVKLLTLISVRIPDDLELAMNTGTRKSMMFYNCQVSSQMVRSICASQQLREVLLASPIELTAGDMQQLIHQPDLKTLIVAGAWVGREHLQALTEAKKRLSLRIDKSELPLEDEKWLRERLPKEVTLHVQRSNGDSIELLELQERLSHRSSEDR